MKKISRVVSIVFASVIGIAFTLAAVNVFVYFDSREKCDEVPRAELDAHGVKLPDDAKVCADRGGSKTGATADYRLLVPPGPICIASGGKLGCAPIVKVGNDLTLRMAAAGWGTGNLQADEEHGQWDFEREDARVSMRLMRTRYDELWGSLEIRGRRAETR